MIDADDLDDLIAALPSGALYEAISDRGAWEARARFLTLAQETGTWLAGGGKGHAQVQET